MCPIVKGFSGIYFGDRFMIKMGLCGLGAGDGNQWVRFGDSAMGIGGSDSGIKDRGSRIGDRGSGIGDRGSGIGELDV